MTRALSLTLCLLLPVTALAEDPAGLTPPPDAPTVGAPVAPSNAPLTPAPAGATEGTRACSMGYGKCCGKGGKGKWIVLTGVVGTIVTAAAVGLAVAVASSRPGASQVP